MLKFWDKLKRLYRLLIGSLTGVGVIEQSLPGNTRNSNDPDLTKISNEIGISWQSKRQKWIVQVKHDGVRRTIGRRCLYDDAIALKRAWEELTKKNSVRPHPNGRGGIAVG